MQIMCIIVGLFVKTYGTDFPESRENWTLWMAVPLLLGCQFSTKSDIVSVFLLLSSKGGAVANSCFDLQEPMEELSASFLTKLLGLYHTYSIQGHTSPHFLHLLFPFTQHSPNNKLATKS